MAVEGRGERGWEGVDLIFVFSGWGLSIYTYIYWRGICILCGGVCILWWIVGWTQYIDLGFLIFSTLWEKSTYNNIKRGFEKVIRLNQPFIIELLYIIKCHWYPFPWTAS